MQKKKKNLLAVGLLILFLLSVFGGAKGIQFFLQPYNNTAEKIEVKKPEKDKPTVVLVIGVDETSGDKGRADSIMVAFVNDKQGVINLVSIPRDSYVNIPGRGNDKINHSFAFGGVSLTLETVEKFIGVPINYYVKTNLEGLKGIIDVLGGLELDVEKKIVVGAIQPGKWITINPGVQTLSGEQAVAYSRFRNDAKGDFGRMERQQKVLRAIAKELLKPANILKAPKLVPELNSFVETNMNISYMLKLSTIFKGKNEETLVTHSLPATPFGSKGVSYIKVDEEKKQELISDLYKVIE